jgi:hypothetical protein
MSLFKFLPPERFGILKKLQIRFTPGDAFDDPFEITPSAKFMDDPEYFAAFVARTSRSAAEKELAEAKISPAQLAERTADIAAELRADYRKDPTGIKGLALGAIRKRFGEYRILCLSRVAPNDPAALLLWAHYTDGHKGLVLEFDEEHHWIKSHDSSRRLYRDMGEVEYLDGRVEMKGPKMNIDRRCYLAKSTHWVYEQELRLLRLHCDHELDENSLGSFPPSLLKSVTIGAGRSEEHYFGLLKDWSSRSDLQHVILYQGQLHVEEFRVARRVIQGPGDPKSP